jgi:methylmalonyl-CoA/ethylmalonyl-CoA epimerase
VISSEELERPHVRLTYLDAGNAFIQLVEPLDDTTDLARHLAEHGEGLHHICFGVDDVLESARSLAEGTVPEPVAGSGRGRMSAFVPGRIVHGARIECTEFDYQVDVVQRTGWLPD